MKLRLLDGSLAQLDEAHLDDLADVFDSQPISRRPCSAEDIAGGLGLQRNEVRKHTEALDAQGLLEKQCVGQRLYYVGVMDPDAPAG